MAVEGGRGAAGSRPAPPPTPRGDLGRSWSRSRGNRACVATQGLSLFPGCVLPSPPPPPPRLAFRGRATLRELPARAGALRFPPLRLGRPGGAGPGALRACSMGSLRGRPAGARGAWWGPRGCERACSPEPHPPPPRARPGAPLPPATPRRAALGFVCLGWPRRGAGGGGVGPPVSPGLGHRT